MSKIEKIEVAIRAQICLRLDALYGPFWIEDPKVFSNPSGKFDYAKFIGQVKEEVDRVREPFLAVFFSNHKTARLPPSWMISEALSFKKWVNIYQNLADNQSRKAISQVF